MRVALVSEVWSPGVDGLVTRLENTVRQLRLAGHEVLVVAPTTGTTIPGVVERRTPTVRIRWLYGGQVWALPGPVVARSLAQFRPDVVHVVNPVLMGVVAGRHVASRYPMVVSYHTDVATYAAHYHLGAMQWAIHAMMRSTYARADVRLATSEVGREHLAALRIGDVDLWPRGVDRELFHPGRDRTRLRARTGAGPDLPLALHVGRIAAEKGSQHLAPMATSQPPVQLVYVGDGPDRSRLEREMAGTGAVFTGVLRGQDLADAYAGADALVFASATDTLGLVLLEAMAVHLPVVAVDTPTARQTLAGYGPVTFVPPGSSGVVWNEAVHAAASTRDRAGTAGAGGTGSWAAATEHLVEVYQRARGRT